MEVIESYKIGKGKYKDIGEDLRKKRSENPEAIKMFGEALFQIYNCEENDVDIILTKYPNLKKSFKEGGDVETVLKIIKWMFILEDTDYWSYKGPAKLYEEEPESLKNL